MDKDDEVDQEKPDTEQHISVKVVTRDGIEMFIGIGKTSEFSKLMADFCAAQGIVPSSVVFIYKASLLHPEQTPESVGMEEGDAIEVIFLEDYNKNGGNIPSTSSNESSEHISLNVVGQSGSEIFFKIKKKTKFKKLIDAYCQRQAVEPLSVRFLYDGVRIQPDQTPESLEMEDGDIIDAVLQQTGGM